MGVISRLIKGMAGNSEDKDVIIRSKDPVRELLSKMKERADASLNERKFFEPQWAMNRAYYLNNQWVEWSDRTSRLRLDVPERTRLTINRMRPLLLQKIAKVTKNDPTLVVSARRRFDEAASDAARGMNMWLSYKLDELSWKRIIQEALMWMYLEGKSFMVVGWDPNKGPLNSATMPVLKTAKIGGEDGTDKIVSKLLHWPLDEDGEIIAPEKNDVSELTEEELSLQFQYHPGDIILDYIPAHEFIPSDGATCLDECRWMIWQRAQSLEDIKSNPMFENTDKVSAEPMETYATNEAFVGTATGARSWYGFRSTDSRKFYDEDAAMVKLCYHRPDNTYPQGFTLIWAGDTPLYFEESLPYESEHGPDFPVVELAEGPTTGRFWPPALAEIMMSTQYAYNLGRSQEFEYLKKIAIGVLTYPSGTIQPTPTMAAGSHIEFDGPIRPEPVRNDPLPGTVEQVLERTLADMNEIAGLYETSKGIAESGVKSGFHAQLLQDADDTKLAPTVDLVESAISRLGQMLVNLAATHYDEDQFVSVLGKNRKAEIREIKRDDFKLEYLVKVAPGSMLPESKALKHARIVERWQAGLYGDPTDIKTRRHVARLLDASDAETIFESIELDEEESKQELAMFLDEGYPLVVKEWDNDDVHREHNERWLKSSEAKDYPDEIIHAVWEHSKRHKIAGLLKAAKEEILAKRVAALTEASGPGVPESGPEGQAPGLPSMAPGTAPSPPLGAPPPMVPGPAPMVGITEPGMEGAAPGTIEQPGTMPPGFE